MGDKRSLQESAVSKNVAKTCEELGIASPMLGAIEQPLHGCQCAALIDLKMRVQIVRKGEIRVQAQSSLKCFVGSPQAFQRAQAVFVQEPTRAPKPDPGRSVRLVETHAP